jgi:archaellum biogenesis ATPase FlaH
MQGNNPPPPPKKVLFSISNSAARGKFHPCYLPVEFEGVNGLNKILFPDNKPPSFSKKETDGFKLPTKKPQMEPRVILIKGEPGVGKTFFCAQLLHHFIQHLSDVIENGNKYANTDIRCIRKHIAAITQNQVENTYNDLKINLEKRLNDAKDCKKAITALVNSNPIIRYILTNDSNGGLKNILENVFGWEEVTTEVTDQTPKHDIDELWEPQIKTFVEVSNKAKTWYPSLFSHDELYKPCKNGDILYEPKIVFLDSMNLINTRMSHASLRTFIMGCKEKEALTFIITEHYNAHPDDVTSQLQAQMEFLADAIIELNMEYREEYTTHSIRVPKMHYGRQTIGKHHYVSGGRVHSTSNIEENRKGIIIYPSLHYYLSHALKDTFSMQNNFFHTGINELDALLRKKSTDSKSKHIIPDDSLFLLQGDASMYMTPIGLSLLCGGMFKYWQDDKLQNCIRADRDVLLISLSEEGNIDLFNTALSQTDEKNYLTNILEWRFQNATVHPSIFTSIKGIPEDSGEKIWVFLKDNGILDSFGNVQKEYLSRIDSLSNPDKVFTKYEPIIRNILSTALKGEKHFRCITDCHMNALFSSMDGHSKNVDKKIIINKWCAFIHDEENKQPVTCRKIVVMSFRPGCISPEQFLQLIENVLDKGAFSRVLFDSTAMIGSRFPLLAATGLFLPALIRLFKSRNMISIFMNPTGDGSDENLSFGLKNLADYTIDIGGIDRDGEEALGDKQYRRISIDNTRNRNFQPIKRYIQTDDLLKGMGDLDKNTVDQIEKTLSDKGFIGKNKEILGIPNNFSDLKKKPITEQNFKDYFIHRKKQKIYLQILDKNPHAPSTQKHSDMRIRRLKKTTTNKRVRHGR